MQIKQFLVIQSTDFTPDTAFLVEVTHSFVLIRWRNAGKIIVNQTEEEQEMNSGKCSSEILCCSRVDTAVESMNNASHLVDNCIVIVFLDFRDYIVYVSAAGNIDNNW